VREWPSRVVRSPSPDDREAPGSIGWIIYCTACRRKSSECATCAGAEESFRNAPFFAGSPPQAESSRPEGAEGGRTLAEHPSVIWPVGHTRRRAFDSAPPLHSLDDGILEGVRIASDGLFLDVQIGGERLSCRIRVSNPALHLRIEDRLQGMVGRRMVDVRTMRVL